jgi:hypothetical protein
MRDCPLLPKYSLYPGPNASRASHTIANVLVIAEVACLEAENPDLNSRPGGCIEPGEPVPEGALSAVIKKLTNDQAGVIIIV